MTRCEAIRALIPNSDSAMKVGQIVAALPQYQAKAVRESIGLMFNADPPILDRIGNRSEGFAYFAAREVQIKAYPTEEARRAATRERELLRNRRRRGGGSLAELRQRQAEARAAKVKVPKQPRKGRMALAEFRAMQAAKREQKAREKAERARLRVVKLAAEKAAAAQVIAARRERDRRRKAADRARRNLTPAQRILAHGSAIVAADKPMQAAPAKPRVESVEEFLARGGRIQRVETSWDMRRAA